MVAGIGKAALWLDDDCPRVTCPLYNYPLFLPENPPLLAPTILLQIYRIYLVSWSAYPVS